MASADFLQFVVTTHFFQYVYFMRLQDLPGYSHVLSLHVPTIFTMQDSVQLLDFDLSGSLILLL